MQKLIVDQVLYYVAFVIATFLVGYISLLAKSATKAVLLWAESKIGSEDWARLEAITRDVVAAIEQNPAFKELVGAEKKERAFLMIREFAQSLGVPFTDQQLDILIEACVKRLTDESAPQFPQLPGIPA